MTTRVLPPEEWPRLVGTDAEAVLGQLDPRWTSVVVVEDAGRIVAHHLLVHVVHAEGLWVDPAYRHGLAGGRLWHAVQREAARLGVHALMTASIDPMIDTLIAREGGWRIEHHGQPIAHFMIPLAGRTKES